MKNRSSTTLTSIKTNQKIVQILRNSKKLNLPYLTIWLAKHLDQKEINYALLVNKNQFKYAVVRNKVKRQLRDILIKSYLKGGFQLLIKPNTLYLKKKYSDIKEETIQLIKKYQNGK